MSTTETTLWLDPGFGASGDMMLGTLIGLGAPVETIRAGLETLAVDGWSLDHETTLRCSLSATRALVDIAHGPGGKEHHHRGWSTIDALLAESDLPDRVKRGARSTFRRLGEVEAAIHNVDIDEVHFHEVGAIDAIVDIVGAWLALDALGISRVVSGPVGVGRGSVDAAHGRLPIPAPATAQLLIGTAIRSLDVAAETITPTGAALLATMSDDWGPIPDGRLLQTARGAGGRDPEHYPNVLTSYLIETADLPSDNDHSNERDQLIETVEVVVLTSNLDDVTAEVVGNTINRCLALGADDAWATPIIMKKGRPGVELNVMCSTDRVGQLRQLVFAETGSLGLRTSTVNKHMLPRRFEAVTIRGWNIAIKVGPHGAKPEYDDLVAASNALDLPVRQLAIEAQGAFAAQAKKTTDDQNFPARD